MAAVVLRRLAFALPALLLAATVAFLLAHLAPGGPAVALGGEHGAEGYLEEVARRYGLDRPLWRIWLDWLGRLAVGDLGYSYRAQVPVLALILDRLPVTLALTVPAVLLSAGAGMALGLAGVPAPGRPRRVLVPLMAGLHAVPSYLVAQALVIVFALWLGVLPVQGLADDRAPAATAAGRVLDGLHHLVLPVIALTLHHLTFVALLTRARVAAEMARPYAATGLAKGLAVAAVRRRHALPNAVVPLVTLFGARLGSIAGGAVVVETVFGLPGLGRLAATSAIARDHPVVIGVVLVACAVIAIANLAVDVAVHWLDPRTEAVRS